MTKSLRGIIAPEDVHLDVPATCKRSVFEFLATVSAERFNLHPADIQDRLQERERLGSTGVGGGIAIPHARLPVSQLCGVALRLREGIDFDAIDGGAVDIVFMLLAPERDDASHLKALSRVARTFRMPGVVQAIRGASASDAAYAALVAETDQAAA